MDYKYKITLFTPTYNRAYIIDALYRSVQRQTYRDFEWIIIDDGSTDNTEEVVNGWLNDNNDFPIRYYKVKNGGKCRAINKGLDLAEGELFFNVDSDDYLTDDAVEKIILWEKELPKGESAPKFCGVVGNLGTSESETPNTPLGESYRDVSLLERYSEASSSPIDGERAWVFYTEIQKKHKYPIFEGETFMTEAVSWNRMAHEGYKVRVFDDIIWVYEYQPDGLTASVTQRYIDNPRGHGLWLKEMAEFLNYSFSKRFKMYYSYYCDHHHHLTLKQMAEFIGAPMIMMQVSKFFFKIRH